MTSEHRRACSTIAKRKALAARVKALADRYGAVTTISPSPLTPTDVSVTVAFNVFRVSMTFRGRSNVGAFLGHWHINDYDSDRSIAYPVEFGADIRGSRNPYHGRKATTCEDTFDGFLHSIERGLICLRDNGYSPAIPAAADSSIAA